LRRHITVKKLTVLFVVCVVFGIVPVSAVDNAISESYRQIDTAFTDRSDSELGAILKSGRTSGNYDLIEAYTMKRIRRLIIASDFKFAEQAVLVVIDANLDNSEAVDMYASIQDALEKQAAYEKQQEDLKVAEENRIEREKESQRKKADKEYKSVKTASGGSVYLTGRDERYSSVYWNACFGLANLMFVSESPHDYSSLRYGLSASFAYEYALRQGYVLGVDASAGGIILPLYNDDKTMMGSLRIVPKISFNSFNRNIFIRAGFESLITAAAGSVTVLQGNFMTPAVGIGFSHLKFGNMKLSGYFDYYPGHVFYENINSAMGAGFTAALPVARMDQIQLNFNVGFTDDVYIKADGVENHACVIFAFGVENVTE
jgi:hypothetical protein